MVRHANTLGLVLLLAASACSRATPSPRMQFDASLLPAVKKTANKSLKVDKELAALDEAMAETGPRPRMLGDFHVYEYSGAFTKKPSIP